MNLKSAKEWSKNISYNYKHGYGSLYRDLIDAVEDLGLDYNQMDQRWQHCNVSLLEKWEYILYLITGKEIGGWKFNN